MGKVQPHHEIVSTSSTTGEHKHVLHPRPCSTGLCPCSKALTMEQQEQQHLGEVGVELIPGGNRKSQCAQICNLQQEASPSL